MARETRSDSSTAPLTTEDYVKLNARFCAPTHAPIPIVVERGHGARVWDIDGNEYIDFLSAFSVVNQGHCHPRIVEAMVSQSQKLAICTSALQNQHYPVLCKKACELLGYDLAASMSSGSEAVDVAIKIARKWGYNMKGIPENKAKILTVTGKYHGKVLGPLCILGGSPGSITGFGPILPNVGHDVLGSPIRFNCIEDIERAFEVDGDGIAAIILERVQGYGGCVPAEPGYIPAVYNLCRKHNVLFIADEIQTGFGRTGWLMSYQQEGIRPDIVILGEALTGGQYPMSMVVGDTAVMTQIKPGQPPHALNLPQCTKINVTGRGLFCALHFDESSGSGRVMAERLGMLLLKKGLIAIWAENRIRIAPPLVIAEEDLWKGVDIIEKSLHELANEQGRQAAL
ncbi:pyridoxal phosphate-dependent transferase [Aspergillus desertorum]